MSLTVQLPSSANALKLTFVVQLLHLIRDWMFDGSVILLVGPALARTLLVMPERTVPPMDTTDALGLLADAIRRQQRAEQVRASQQHPCIQASGPFLPVCYPLSMAP